MTDVTNDRRKPEGLYGIKIWAGLNVFVAGNPKNAFVLSGKNPMITLNAANARIKRQNIEKQAGESYLSPSDIRDRIVYFREDFHEQFLFGIYDTPNRWTVLSVKKLYACYDGDPFYLVLNKKAKEIHEYSRRAGRKDYIDVELADGRKIWMKTVGLSCSIQNIILMLEQLPDNAHLE